jgi:hypothetical protein
LFIIFSLFGLYFLHCFSINCIMWRSFPYISTYSSPINISGEPTDGHIVLFNHDTVVIFLFSNVDCLKSVVHGSFNGTSGIDFFLPTWRVMICCANYLQLGRWGGLPVGTRARIRSLSRSTARRYENSEGRLKTVS